MILRHEAAATLAVRMEAETGDAQGKNGATSRPPAQSQADMGSISMIVVHDSSIYYIKEIEEPGVGAIDIQLGHTEK